MFKSYLQSRWTFVLFWGLVVAVAGLRLWYVCLAPIYTTDVLRNIGYGEAFWEWGFHIYSLTAFDLSPSPAQFLWHAHHYTYPAMTLLFFAFTAAFHNSIFFAKMVLTLFDAANSCLIVRITKERWLGLCYWIYPISIWYTSHEGQFEAWVVFWMLVAIHELRRGKPWAFAALGLAIQTKLFPVLLIPYFLKHMSWKNLKLLCLETGFGIMSFFPSFYAILKGTYLTRFLQPGYMPDYNPLTWFIVEPQDFPEFPFWLIVGHFLGGFIFVVICINCMKKKNQFWPLFAPLAFVVLVKANIIGQFWYMMLVPAFCMTVEDRKARRVLVIVSFLLGLRSLYSICIGPIGYANPPDAQELIRLSFWGY